MSTGGLSGADFWLISNPMVISAGGADAEQTKAVCVPLLRKILHKDTKEDAVGSCAHNKGCRIERLLSGMRGEGPSSRSRRCGAARPRPIVSAGSIVGICAGDAVRQRYGHPNCPQCLLLHSFWLVQTLSSRREPSRRPRSWKAAIQSPRSLLDRPRSQRSRRAARAGPTMLTVM